MWRGSDSFWILPGSRSCEIWRGFSSDPDLNLPRCRLDPDLVGYGLDPDFAGYGPNLGPPENVNDQTPTKPHSKWS